MKLKGAQIIVETLIEQGASTVFGYPGGQVIDIYDALYLAQDRIHHIITCSFCLLALQVYESSGFSTGCF